MKIVLTCVDHTLVIPFSLLLLPISAPEPYNISMTKQLTHIDEQGNVKMVDVGHKPDTERTAVARGTVLMQPETLERIMAGNLKKGNVLTTAQLAGIMAAKRTSELIPLCHPLPLTHIDLTFRPNPAANQIEIEAIARTRGKTGVEMEALTAVSVAALTIYDMAKAIDRSMRLTDMHLVAKSGGQSGDWQINN